MPAKTLLSSAILMHFSTQALACGLYEVRGTARLTSEGYRIIVAEKTKSESTFVIPVRLATQLFPYKDAPVTALVSVLSPFDETIARVDGIESVKLRIPDPLHPEADTFYRLKKKQTCRK